MLSQRKFQTRALNVGLSLCELLGGAMMTRRECLGLLDTGCFSLGVMPYTRKSTLLSLGTMPYPREAMPCSRGRTREKGRKLVKEGNGANGIAKGYNAEADAKRKWGIWFFLGDLRLIALGGFYIIP